MKFKGKNILLIGGTSGIGKATLDILLEEGASITVASRQAPSDHENITHIPLDVLEMTDELDALPEQLHGLVYTPGTITLKPFQSLKPADFQREIESKCYRCSKSYSGCTKKLASRSGG